jgi:hypothetical protein
MVPISWAPIEIDKSDFSKRLINPIFPKNRIYWARDKGRVFCILREQYAHLMGMLGDDMTEHLLQQADFSSNNPNNLLQ